MKCDHLVHMAADIFAVAFAHTATAHMSHLTSTSEEQQNHQISLSSPDSYIHYYTLSDEENLNPNATIKNPPALVFRGKTYQPVWDDSLEESKDAQQTEDASPRPTPQRFVWPPVYKITEYIIQALDGAVDTSQSSGGTTRYVGVFVRDQEIITKLTGATHVLFWIYDLQDNLWIEVVRREQVYYGRWKAPLRMMDQDIIEGGAPRSKTTSTQSFIMHAAERAPLLQLPTLDTGFQNHYAPRFGSLPIHLASSEDWIFWSQRALVYMTNLNQRLYQLQQEQKTSTDLFNNLQAESQRMQEELINSLSLHEELVERVTMLESQNTTLQHDHQHEQDNFQMELEDERSKRMQVDEQLKALQEEYAAAQRKWNQERDLLNEELANATRQYGEK